MMPRLLMRQEPLEGEIPEPELDAVTVNGVDSSAARRRLIRELNEARQREEGKVPVSELRARYEASQGDVTAATVAWPPRPLSRSSTAPPPAAYAPRTTQPRPVTTEKPAPRPLLERAGAAVPATSQSAAAPWGYKKDGTPYKRPPNGQGTSKAALSARRRLARVAAAARASTSTALPASRPAAATPLPTLLESIEQRFSVRLLTPRQETLQAQLHGATKSLAHVFAQLTPASHEQDMALTHLEEAMMWACAAVARHPKAGVA